MILCKVTGSIVSTQKNETLKEYKILIVQPIDTDGNAIGKDVLSLDTLDAGVGDIVLIIQEGSGAMQILNRNDVPVHTIIIAIIDGIDVAIKA